MVETVAPTVRVGPPWPGRALTGPRADRDLSVVFSLSDAGDGPGASPRSDAAPGRRATRQPGRAMSWTRTRQVPTSAALAGLIATLAPSPAVAADRTGPTQSAGTTAAKGTGKPTPPPPRLPRNFHGRG